MLRSLHPKWAALFTITMWNKFQALCPSLCSYKTEVVEAAGPTPGHSLLGGKGTLEGNLNPGCYFKLRPEIWLQVFALSAEYPQFGHLLQWDIFLNVNPYFFIVWDCGRDALGTLTTSHLKARWLRNNALLRDALCSVSKHLAFRSLFQKMPKKNTYRCSKGI